MPYAFQLDDVVRSALHEDAAGNDITSMIVDPASRGEALFMAKQEFILCGTAPASLAFSLVDRDSLTTFAATEGERVGKGTVFGIVSGRLRSILTAERTALNFLQCLSGVSTATRAAVDAVAGTNARILDTRKTTPGLRQLQKHAVRCGGGMNHRMTLADGILIKDNHIAALGGIAQAVTHARRFRTALVKIEVEVNSIDQLNEALDAGADHIMLDNMTPAMVAEAVGIVGGRVPLEASGGITLDTIRDYAETGVDYISLGWITHSAPAVDISLEF